MTVVIAEITASVASPVVVVGANIDFIVPVARDDMELVEVAAVVDEDAMVTADFTDDGKFVTNIGAAQVVTEGNAGVLVDVVTATELKVIGTEGVPLKAAAAEICKDS